MRDTFGQARRRRKDVTMGAGRWNGLALGEFETPFAAGDTADGWRVFPRLWGPEANLLGRMCARRHPCVGRAGGRGNRALGGG